MEEKRVSRLEIAAGDLGERIEFYLRSKSVSGEVKQALAELRKRQQAVAEATRKREELQKQAREITAEQQRIRANLERIDKMSELYGRYIRKLTSQEDELETIGEQVKQLERQEERLRSELGDFVLGLNVK